MHTRELVSNAIQYIDDHLTKGATVEQAAAVAGYSRHHFSRTFLMLTGLTPNSYLRKRRLSEAARELVTSSRSILMIALDYQFGSQEAFTRSFKQEFGISPGCYRQQGRLNRYWGQISLAFSNLLYPGQGLDPSPKLHVAEQKNFVATGCRRITSSLRAHSSTRLSNTVHIRQAHRQDIQVLCRLYHELNELMSHGALQQQQMLEEIESFDAAVQTLFLHKSIGTGESLDVSIWVAEIGEQVVGLAEVILCDRKSSSTSDLNRYGILRSLMVKRNLCGYGIGEQLLSAAEAWLGERGATELRMPWWQLEQEQRGFCNAKSERLLPSTHIRML